MVPAMPRKALYGVGFAFIFPFVAGWLLAGGGPSAAQSTPTCGAACS